MEWRKHALCLAKRQNFLEPTIGYAAGIITVIPRSRFHSYRIVSLPGLAGIQLGTARYLGANSWRSSIHCVWFDGEQQPVNVSRIH
jgi:hypothetical protein